MKLQLKDFNFFKNAKNVKKIMIYFAIYDNDTKEYLEYATYSKKDINDEIVLEKRSLIVRKTSTFISFDANLSFKFLIVPIISENEDYIFSLEKCFYNSTDFINENEDNKYQNTVNVSKKILSFLSTKILPLFILIIIPTNIYTYLINDIGLVDSLIDMSVVTTTFIYLLNGTMNLIFENIVWILIGSVIFIPLYGVLIIFIGSYFYFFASRLIRFLRKNILRQHINKKYEIFLEKIDLNRSLNDTVPLFQLFKSLKYYYLSILIYSLGVLFFFIIFFITQVIDVPNTKNTVISISANQYIQYSAFPRLAKIKYRNNECKEQIVLFMGYDKIYSYYYNIEYIDTILSKYSEQDIKALIKDYRKINEDKMKNENKKVNIEFQDLFKSFLIGNIENSNIKAIKNDMYDLYNIDNFKLNINEFSKIKKMNNLLKNNSI